LKDNFMTVSLENFKEILSQRPEVVSVTFAYGDLSVIVEPTNIVGFLTYLRDDKTLRFLQLIDLCGADYPARVKRFEVVYHLLSLHNNLRLRVKMPVAEDEIIPSVVKIYPIAEWNERETFDMYGISFAAHPDLRRILTDYGFTGYPLRKDFPTTGYVELRYDTELKRVVYEPVKLTQDFRQFDFLSPWEGAKQILPGDEKAHTEGQK
jgi:NADH-quinone oxidoreductase subunit C